MIYVNVRFLTQKITGVQRFATELCLRLKKINKKVVFLCPKNINNHEIAEKLSVKVIGNNVGYKWEQIDLPIFLKKKGSPLLLNLCNTAPLFYNNKIVTIHDLAFLENPKWFSKSFYWTYRFMIPRIALSSKKIITVSEFSKSEIIKKLGVDKSKICVIYNGVNEKFLFKENNSDFEKYFLFVGSVDPRKNLSRLLSSVQYFEDGINLRIVGAESNVFNKNKGLKDVNKKNIHFHGYVSDDELMFLYKNSLGFIYPSLYEGFGLPPLEAQAANVPIVVSDIPVFREIFDNSAVYCNPNDSYSIAKAINKVASFTKKERELYLEKGKENIRKFDWSQSAKKLNEILELVSGKII